MKCPYCHSFNTKVIDTRRDTRGNVRRRRECKDCTKRFTTVERAILTTPWVIKRDGRREEFDREKVLVGLHTACTRRPIPAETLENIVDKVEYTIRKNGRAEIASHTIGDLVMEELRKVDEVAYIRYATVYLNLSDLEAIRTEIDRLRAQRR
ncbi:MAG: transcriptional repressor NrdR [Anaerolineae bacterium]|nr:transcriptional repressor NrdR [Anaerolineae bacterium]